MAAPREDGYAFYVARISAAFDEVSRSSVRSAVEAQARARVRDESIAAAGHGLDMLRAGLVFAQRGADLTHRHAERGIADMDGALARIMHEADRPAGDPVT